VKKDCFSHKGSPGCGGVAQGAASRPQTQTKAAERADATPTPEDGLTGRILTLAWPAIMEQLLGMTVGLVNTYLVGHLGASSLAAVGLGSQVFMIFMVLFAAVGVGTTALVARHIGAGEQKKANLITSQSILMAVGVGVVSSVGTLVLAGPALKLLGAAPDVQALGMVYLRIVALTMLLMTVLFVGNAALRGAGDTRTPMLVMSGINLINVVVAYSLINGVGSLPRMGVAGAAIGTAIAQGVGGLAVLILLLRPRSAVRLVPRDFFRLEPRQIRRILSIGLPAGGEQLLMRIAQFSFAALITRLGTATFAAHQIGMMVMSLSYMPGWGFSVASTTLVGQELGAGRPDRAEAGARLSSRLNTMVMGTIGLLIFLGARPVAALFTADQEVIDLAVIALRAFAFAQPLLATSFVLSGAMRGAGDTRPVLLITAFCIWGIRLPLGYLLAVVANLGLLGVWLAVDVDWIVRATLLYRRFRSGRWKTLSV